MAAHRYWRLRFTAGNGQVEVGIAECELRQSISGADVTGSGTASASSGANPSFAFDNNTANVWTSAGGAYPHTLTYDFGAGNDKDIVEVSIIPRSQIRYAPTGFQLQFSDDGAAWTTLFTVDGFGAWQGSSLPIAFSGVSYHQTATSGLFWRLRATAVDGGAVLGLSELMMYDATGNNQCSGGSPHCSTQIETGGPHTYAFNGEVADSTDRWAAFSITNEWIGYKFPSAKTITTIGVVARSDGNHSQSPKNFVVEYWDGAAYVTAMTLTNITGWTSGQARYFNVSGETTAPVPTSSARPQVFFCM